MDVERKGIEITRKALFNQMYFSKTGRIPHTESQLRFVSFNSKLEVRLPVRCVRLRHRNLAS